MLNGGLGLKKLILQCRDQRLVLLQLRGRVSPTESLDVLGDVVDSIDGTLQPIAFFPKLLDAPSQGGNVRLGQRRSAQHLEPVLHDAGGPSAPRNLALRRDGRPLLVVQRRGS